MSGTWAFGFEDVGMELFGLRLGLDDGGISEEGSEQGLC